MSFTNGDTCFFKHPTHSWVVGSVTSGAANNWTCKSNDEVRKCVGETHSKLKDADVTNCREDLLEEMPDDLLSLTILHDSTLLRCLYIRYMKDIIYTNIGAIVVALNPFNFKIPWYMDEKMKDYLQEGAVIEKNIPHSWAQAHNTYNEMIADNANQCILISGESGAGKTEATKIVMKYLAKISSQKGTDEEKASGLAVGVRLNSCSPFLESFGNAKTVRNDNSSRFGKFMEVKFSTTGQLVGAHTRKYLLEKSRIVTASENERVYHAFYMIPRGKLASKLKLDEDKNYKSLNAGKCLNNSEFNSAKDFDDVCGAMSGIGMSEEDITSVWTSTGGILDFLNLGFKAKGESSEVEESTRKYLENCISLWQVDGVALEKELSVTTLQMKDGPMEKLLKPAASVDVRDALAKALYNATFSWLVDKSNELCDVSTGSGNWIGLLDIFGFEDFTHNSFEQLCINLANETLQNHYNGYIFTKDMEDCRAEGVDVTEVKCPDNMPCLKLISAKGGIINLLDDECARGESGTNQNFLTSVVSIHGKHEFFGTIKTSRDHFVVHHYAASVKYDVTGWLEKNKDTLKDAFMLIMRASQNKLIASLLDEPVPQDQKKGRQITVGGFFKDQVHQLITLINSTNPHWIRCVKPHPAKKALMFDGIQTMSQLESSGVLGTVKIRKAGYPIRTSFEKFNIRYKIILHGNAAATGKTGRDQSDEILKQAKMKDKAFAQLGTTKVFMKSEAFPAIERLRNEFLQKHVKCLQANCRGFQTRVKANKDYCERSQRDFSAKMIAEYRAYMKRSAIARAERARIRKEAEEKYRVFRVDLEVQSATARNQNYDEYLAGAQQYFKLLQKEVTLEKKKFEATRADREAFLRTEYLARSRIADEALAAVEYCSELYEQEVQLFLETEMDFIEERENICRAQQLQNEASERNLLWKSFTKMKLDSQLDSLTLLAFAWRPSFEALEEVQRAEMDMRMKIEKKHHVLRKHYKKQRHEEHQETKTVEKQRRRYDRWKDQEIFKLEQLKRDEMYRLQIQAASQRHSLNSSAWEAPLQDAPLSSSPQVAPSPIPRFRQGEASPYISSADSSGGVGHFSPRPLSTQHQTAHTPYHARSPVAYQQPPPIPGVSPLPVVSAHRHPASPSPPSNQKDHPGSNSIGSNGLGVAFPGGFQAGVGGGGGPLTQQHHMVMAPPDSTSVQRTLYADPSPRIAVPESNAGSSVGTLQTDLRSGSMGSAQGTSTGRSRTWGTR